MVEAISGRVGGNAHVIPAILLPAAGYKWGELIRHLAGDFDSWAVTVAPTENVSLAAARSEIWNVIKKFGSGKNDSNKVKGLQLPLGFRNTRRGNFTAGVIDCIWPGDDVVHLTDAAYDDIGAAILDLWRNSKFTARKRVDSIIVEGGSGIGERGRGG
jgi:hypothetical protein